jgi:hypothetical protein
MRSLRDMHELNTYMADHVRLTVCPHDLVQEPLGQFGYYLVWTLCHHRLVSNRTFRVPTIGSTNMADAQTCEVVSTLAPLNYKAIQLCVRINLSENIKHCHTNNFYDVKNTEAA